MQEARKALNLLRRKRRFDELERLASMLMSAGHTHPRVRQQLAQARLDQGRIDPALRVLEGLAAEVEDDPTEGPEVRGLIGRAYKQRYVAGGDAGDMKAAVEAYARGWERREGDHRWAGINLVALLERARRDGLALPNGRGPAAPEIARQILAEIEAQDDLRVWDYGTALEASLALGRQDESLRWARRYGEHPGADAFELGSTLRQLREVWRVQESPTGAAISEVLEYELLKREGSFVDLDPGHEARRPGARDAWEAVYGAESYTGFQWLDSLYGLAQGVARIQDRVTGEAWGTGFLMPGSSLCPEWGDAPVLVTNAHVVSEEPADEAPLRPEEAAAEFTRLEGRPRVNLGEPLFCSRREHLDCMVVRIEGIEAPLPSPNFHRPRIPGADEAPQRLYVMGYPLRGELVVSLNDNHLVGYDDAYVHYRSPTEGGSSGSPVLTRKLRALAVHHRKKDELSANEGVLLAAIRDEATRLATEGT